MRVGIKVALTVVATWLQQEQAELRVRSSPCAGVLSTV
jgi:hypothetical protein